MNISIEARNLIDNSFRLGYLFSVIIFDIQKILDLVEKNDFKKTLHFLESDFIIKFNSLEFFFQNLYETKGISEDELTHIKNFCTDSTEDLNLVISALKNTGKLTEEDISLMKKLLKNMNDF